MNNQYNNYQFNNQRYNNKKNNDEARKKLIISILGLAIVLVAIIGISFAMYKATIVTNPSKIETGSVTVSFTESNNYIDIKNAIPISDETGKKSEDNSFDFAVTTTAETKTRVPYTISVTTDEDNTLDDSYVKLYLEKEGSEVVSPCFVSDLSTYVGRTNSKTLYSSEDSYEESGEKITHYKLKVWVDKDFEVTSDSSKTYKLKINVDSLILKE